MAASISFLRRALLVGRETTPYQAASLIATTHGLADIREIDFTPDIKRIDSTNLVKQTYGPSQAQWDAAGSMVSLNVTTPVFKPVTPGSLPPGLAELLFACGLQETINTGVSVVYTPQTPISTYDAQTATLEFYEAGKRHRLIGARGTFTLIGKPGQPLLCKVEVKAPWEMPVGGVDAPVAAAAGVPLTFSGAVAVTEDGGEIDIGSFEFSLGAELVEDVGSTGATVYLTNHTPILKINPFAVANAAEWDRLVNANQVAFLADFGSSNLVLNIGQAQLTETGNENRGGRFSHPQTWECLENSGDDQFSLIFK